MTTERSRRLQSELRVRGDARQSGLESHAGSGRWSSRSRRRQNGQTRGPPPGRVAARRTDALHEKAPVQTQRTRTRNARTPMPDTGRPHLDIGQRTRGHRGHWTVTPDTGRVDPTEHTDRAPRLGRHPDRHPGPPRPPDRPLGRRTVDLWTAPAARGNDDGSATVRYLPARDYLPHYQRLLGRSVVQAAPWRTAVLGRFRVERRARRWRSSVMARLPLAGKQRAAEVACGVPLAFGAGWGSRSGDRMLVGPRS
jgi:hypothetical protein